MSDSWSEYMKEYGQEEYDAWEAAISPYTDRIAQLEQQIASALALIRESGYGANARDLDDALRQLIQAAIADRYSIQKAEQRISELVQIVRRKNPVPYHEY